MLRDWIYRSKKLATTRSVVVDGTLEVGGAFTAPGLAQEPNTPRPADHGLIAWTMDPWVATSSQISINGSLYLAAVFLRQASTISTVWWTTVVVAATPTAGQNYVGLYAANGTLLASAGIDADLTSVGVRSKAVTPVSCPAGRYWVAFLFNAATAPTLARGGGVSSGANAANLGAADLRAAVNGTGRTSLPSTITPASNSTTGALALWAAVS